MLSSGGRAWFRVPLVAALCLLLLWISIGPSLNVLLARSAPATALRWWPMGAQAKAALATKVLLPGASRTAVEAARKLAAQALEREPVLAPAARALGQSYAAAGDLAGADRVFTYAERTSRRDLPTQLWLIQRRVEQGDVAGALIHYDLALRTNRPAYDTLLPILTAASGQPAVRDALLPYLARRPSWADEYLYQLTYSTDDAVGLFAQVRARRYDLAREKERALVAKAVQRLVALNRPDLAFRLTGGHASGLRNGGFEQTGGFLPFDWWLRDAPGLAAYRDSSGAVEGRFVLHVTATGEQGGEVARQLVLLPPGRYRLTGLVSGSTEGQSATFLFSLSCTGQDGLVTKRAEASATPGKFAVDFTVPTGCPAQWLRIATPPATNIDGWVDDLALVSLDFGRSTTIAPQQSQVARFRPAG